MCSHAALTPHHYTSLVLSVVLSFTRMPRGARSCLRLTRFSPAYTLYFRRSRPYKYPPYRTRQRQSGTASTALHPMKASLPRARLRVERSGGGRVQAPRRARPTPPALIRPLHRIPPPAPPPTPPLRRPLHRIRIPTDPVTDRTTNTRTPTQQQGSDPASEGCRCRCCVCSQ